MKVLTAEQMRAAEKRAVSSGTTYTRLMVNAGVACADIIIERMGISRDNPMPVAVVCGKGNNGGDGLVIAAVLSEIGCPTTVVLADGIPLQGDPLTMYTKLTGTKARILDISSNPSECEKTIAEAKIIVDAVFGIGFHGKPNIETASLLSAMSASGAVKISVDVPSGVECDTGAAGPNAFRADITIAIAALKPAHVLLPAATCCGDVETVDIGIDKRNYEGLGDAGFFTLGESEVKAKFPVRSPFAHKGDFGHVISIAGSLNYQGAAVLAASGALCSGAGLVTAVFPKCAYNAIAAKLTEAPLLPLQSNELGTFSVAALPHMLEVAEDADSVLLGCGIGLNGDIKNIVAAVVLRARCPLIIDADGINALCDNIDILKAAKAPLILTPHPGEMARLTSRSVDEIQSDRVKAARDFAVKHGVILVLKGANTVVASPDGESVFINYTGNSGMAKGGSGDLLAGIIASFAAQGMSPFDAAMCAVYIHGLSGDAAAARLSQRGMLPGDCLNELPLLLSKFE